MDNDKCDIFFSYSTEDSKIANELRDAIEREGLKCFMAEKDIPTASPWVNKIRNAICSSKKVLILITIRSKDRPWILLEIGAAWVLKKDIIPALMFVKPQDLVEPISRYQARIIETIEQRDALVHEITSQGCAKQRKINGYWRDEADGDMIFFQQRGNRVVGIYDLDGRGSKVGFYFGTIKGGTYEYEWRWYDEDNQGHGKMELSENNKTLYGLWWENNDENSAERLGYDRIKDKMPDWLTENDFNEIWKKYVYEEENKDD